MSKFLKESLGLFAVALICMQLQLLAQDNPINKISISSPTAASLGKYGDIPVNYHTGIPQISIPIYTVSAGPLSLPVSLSYHASGLKVQEPASWVGAGWALNAGGVITRSVMGAPDEKGTNNGGIETNGHFSDYGFNNYVNSNGVQDWQGFARGFKDGEPDLYFFNFGSYSGKFYFRDDRTPIIVPEQDFKIEPAYDGIGNASIQSFKITTPDGVQYYFGNSPGITGTAPVEITKPVTENNGISTANVISSWFLNKISTADNQFAITLSYQAESYGFHTLSMFPIDANATATAGSFGSNHGYDLIKNIVLGVRLSQIRFPNGTVNFIEDTSARTDLSDNTPSLLTDIVNQSAKPLGSIQISDGTNVLRKFNFSYSYFTDNITPLAQDLQNFAPNLQTDRKRLKLDQLQEISGDGTITKPPHFFTYFSEQVPRRLSFGIDHWGFYNGVTSNQTLIPTYTKFGSNTTTNYPGADRDSYWPAMRGGTLQQINYPTGGYSLFDFETNTVYNTTNSIVNVTLASLYVRLYGQSAYSMTSSFVSDGSAMNISFNSTANYSATYTITNSSNIVVYNTTISNNYVSPTNPLTLPQGTYQATLSLPQYANLSGGCTASVTQYQTVQTINNITIGGNRIKTITHSDGVTSNNLVTSYGYTLDNGQSSAVLYSRPAYVGIIRNDLIKQTGYWTINGFVFNTTNYNLINGCPTFPDATYFKSPSSIRPMATTQGNPIGYSQVKVSQAGNGYSIYKYYGTTGLPPWQSNNGDIAIRSVNITGCDVNAPNYPPAPLPFDYKRGELQYEANYNEANQMLKEASYAPVYETSPVTTPAFIVVYQGAQMLGTKYELNTAHKTQTQVIQTAYVPGGGSLTTTSTSFNESPFHREVTRTSTANSKGEALETKKKFAFDFRVSACDGIADGYLQYTTDCNTCLTIYNNARLACGNDSSQCLTTAYLNYLKCQTTARANYVAYRRTNFTNPVNTFKTNHDNAKAAADAELKPVLELQDNFINAPIEITSWNSGKLLSAGFTRYGYGSNPATSVYPATIQTIKLNNPSAFFTPALNSSTSITKDSRYTNETSVKFDGGNMVELTPKEGVINTYVWGYNKNYPVAKVEGASFNTVNAILNQSIIQSPVSDQALRDELNKISQQIPSAMVNTFTYAKLIGITSETDTRGKSKYYQYDGLSRLLHIRDENNNILKKICYNYKGQLENCSANSTAALWQPTGILQCATDAGGHNTGYQQREEKDMNPSSPGYNQTRWVDNGYNATACPPPPSCSPSNCGNEGYACIYGQCEQGYKVYTNSYYDYYTGQYICTYHYEFSDGSWSLDYSEYNYYSCAF